MTSNFFICFAKNKVCLPSLFKAEKKNTVHLISNVEKLSKEAVFAFDIHGVLFKRKLNQILYETVKNIDSSLLFNIFKNPSFLYTTYQLFSKNRVIEQSLKTLGKKYPFFDKYVDRYIEISNLQEPTKAIEIMHELKKLGHKVFILSNIGAEAFEQLKKGNPGVFDIIDGAIVSEASDGYIQKPQPDAYKKLLNNFNLKPENVVFIDDSLRYINAAQKLGINTVHYTSLRDLQDGLEQLGIQNMSIQNTSFQK